MDNDRGGEQGGWKKDTTDDKGKKIRRRRMNSKFSTYKNMNKKEPQITLQIN